MLSKWMLKIGLACTFVCLALFTSCKGEEETGIVWGETDYYEDFLFWKYEPVVMSRTICFDYNEDAVEAKVKPTVFTLYEKQGDEFKPIEKGIKLYKNGELCEGNKFTVNTDEKEAEIGIEFTADADYGSHSMFLKVLDNGGLDRINDAETESDVSPLVDEWRATKNHKWNPLAAGLTLFGIIVAVLLVLWFLYRATFISTFKVGTYMITEPYFSNPRIHGARRVIFTNDMNAKDGFWASLFLGRTIYEKNPIWTNQWELLPGLKKGCRAVTHGKYTISPFATSMKIGTDYEITHPLTGNKVKIKLL